MSITDELREFALGWDERNRIRGNLESIADRIDSEHAQLERDYKVACEVNERQDEQYADMVHKLDRAYEMHLESVELPVDADGVPIHVGDVLTDGEYTFTVFELSTFGGGSWSIRNEDGNAWAACDVTHRHAPTVEDVVADVADKAANLTGSYHEGGMNGDEYMDSMRALVAEYAAKLRLKEDA